MTRKRKAAAAPVAFEIALEQHGPGIHAWLVARVGIERADDLFQETMISALRAWQETQVESVKAWLFKIAGNKVIDDHRRAGREPVLEGQVEAWPSPATEEALEDPIWVEVRALPEKQRQAVTLRFRGDMSHREVGEVMGTSEAAARRNVFEGLSKLREGTSDE